MRVSPTKYEDSGVWGGFVGEKMFFSAMGPVGRTGFCGGDRRGIVDLVGKACLSRGWSPVWLGLLFLGTDGGGLFGFSPLP